MEKFDENQSELSKTDLSGYRERLARRKPEKGIHSYAHQIAKEVCDYLGDAKYKEFGLWMGVAKRIGAGALAAKLKDCRERGVRNARYLLAACRKSK